MSAPVAAFDAIDLSSLQFWEQPAAERGAAFAELRRQRPVSFHRPIDFGFAGLMQQDDPGFWAVATHELVRAASRDADTFCSSNGVLMEDFPPELGEQIASFLVMDGARHHALRRLISSAFTPRNVSRIEDQVAGQAERIVDGLLDAGSCDLVAEVSTRLPLWTISEMVGIPVEERDRVATAANRIVSLNDPTFGAEADPFEGLMGAVVELWEVSLELAAARRSSPADDLMTALVEARVDDRMLTDEEIGAFMVLLAIAGNETTRNTISHTVKALQDFPDQRRDLATNLDECMPTAVEEFIRWATPVIQFRRTATQDTSLGGVDIRAGDKVVLLYESGNRDDSVFAEPWLFDVRRDPNDHLGFGGGGSHYCLGASLARTQLSCLFTELLRRAPDLQVHDTVYGLSNFSHSINAMPCSV